MTLDGLEEEIEEYFLESIIEEDVRKKLEPKLFTLLNKKLELNSNDISYIAIT